MNAEDRQTLEDVAGALYFAADRLADLAQHEEVPVDGHEPIDQARWMRAAKRELSELICEVEGANPPQAPR